MSTQTKTLRLLYQTAKTTLTKSAKTAITGAAIVGAVLLSGCATSPENIAAAYVSPLQYQQYSCEALGAELSRVQNHVSEIAGAQKKTSTKDKISVGVGIFFWPAFFFTASGSDRKYEIARIKGELNAIESSAVQKNCSSLLPTIRDGKKIFGGDKIDGTGEEEPKPES